jgi:hypothetical protein
MSKTTTTKVQNAEKKIEQRRKQMGVFNCKGHSNLTAEKGGREVNFPTFSQPQPAAEKVHEETHTKYVVLELNCLEPENL